MGTWEVDTWTEIDWWHDWFLTGRKRAEFIPPWVTSWSPCETFAHPFHEGDELRMEGFGFFFSYFLVRE